MSQATVLPPLPVDDSIAHVYPWDLERMASNETTATVFSVAVGCPDGESVPLYTAEQMQKYALAATAAQPAAPAGYKLVPIEPAWDQVMAAAAVDLTDWWNNGNAMQIRECSAKDIYRAMLDAAPQGEGK